MVLFISMSIVCLFPIFRVLFNAFRLYYLSVVCLENMRADKYQYLLAVVTVFIEMPIFICLVLLTLKFLAEIYKTNYAHRKGRKEWLVLFLHKQDRFQDDRRYSIVLDVQDNSGWIQHWSKIHGGECS